ARSRRDSPAAPYCYGRSSPEAHGEHRDRAAIHPFHRERDGLATAVRPHRFSNTSSPTESDSCKFEPLVKIRNCPAGSPLQGGSDAGAPPAGGDHVFDAAAGMAALGSEHIPRVLTAKLLENRLGAITEHHHPRALPFDEIRRQDKHASPERGGVQFRDPDLPSPLEPTELLVSQSRIDCELCDPPTVGCEFVEKQFLLAGIQRIGIARTVPSLGDNRRRALEPGPIGPGMAPDF